MKLLLLTAGTILVYIRLTAGEDEGWEEWQVSDQSTYQSHWSASMEMSRRENLRAIWEWGGKLWTGGIGPEKLEASAKVTMRDMKATIMDIKRNIKHTTWRNWTTKIIWIMNDIMTSLIIGDMICWYFYIRKHKKVKLSRLCSSQSFVINFFFW